MENTEHRRQKALSFIIDYLRLTIFRRFRVNPRLSAVMARISLIVVRIAFVDSGF